jgi:hypothetical protein
MWAASYAASRSRTRAPNARRARLARLLAEEEQWAKLRMLVELADEVWGK